MHDDAVDADVVVIGAGFGGLGAALRLRELGARTVLCESLRYPGGCASTFARGGWRFESGATLSSGFDPAQLFARWAERYQLPLRTAALDPGVTLRAPGFTLEVPSTREALLARLCDFPGAPADRLAEFFARQSRAADALWALFDDPSLLPPFDARALWRHVVRAPRYLPLVTMVGRSLAAVLDDHGLAGFAPLRLYADAVSQITVQASAEEAEAPFAVATMDYYFRGTRHVHGGLGALAEALAGAFVAEGGTLRYADAVRGLVRDGDGWRVTTRKGVVRARAVVANLLPQSLLGLLGDGATREARDTLEARAAPVRSGYGAAMLYLGLDPAADIPAGAHHLEIVQDPARPFVEGNHLFVSVSAADEGDRGPGGARTATVSTHIPMAGFVDRDATDQGRYVAAVQESMRAGLRRFAPAHDRAVVHALTASPRTFARFTGRAGGYVGGVPRRVGLHNYRSMAPAPVAPGLWMVGDSVFPGQSTLATALGGVKVAERVAAGARGC